MIENKRVLLYKQRLFSLLPATVLSGQLLTSGITDVRVQIRNHFFNKKRINKKGCEIGVQGMNSFHAGSLV